MLLGWVLSSPAQIITTIAGNALYDRAPATPTPLNLPSGIAVDARGNLWIADTGHHVIRRVDAATGIATIVAGGATIADPTGPIPATSALLEKPTFVAVDRAGNVYFCETARHRVRKISPDGMLSTVAGAGLAGFSGDGGPATRAALSNPEGLAVDASGNLYISDSGNQRVRKVTPATGIITTLAGGGTGGDGGPATSAGLPGQPKGLAFDSRGNFHFALQGPQTVKRVDAATGIITTVAGTRMNGFGCPENVPATSFSLSNPYAIAFDAADNLYLGRYQCIHKVDRSTGLLTTVYPRPGVLFGERSLDFPSVLAVEPSGKILATHRDRSVVLRMDPDTGASTVVAGTTDPFDGPLALAAVSYLNDVASDGARRLLYLCDQGHLSIRKVDLATSEVSTLAPARLHCQRLAVDPGGHLYYSAGGRISRVNAATGFETTIIEGAGFAGDGGPASQAKMAGATPCQSPWTRPETFTLGIKVTPAFAGWMPPRESSER